MTRPWSRLWIVLLLAVLLPGLVYAQGTPRMPVPLTSIIDGTQAAPAGAFQNAQQRGFYNDLTNKRFAITEGLSLAGGQLVLTALGTPSAPTITHAGAAGIQTWTYKVVATNGSGVTAASAAGSTTTGNATLTTTNYNIITWPVVTGATGYQVYRTVSGGTPATLGLIATVTLGSALSTNDTGLAGDASSAPTANTTGCEVIGAPTGGCKGSGSLNAEALYSQGGAVAVAVGGSFTSPHMVTSVIFDQAAGNYTLTWANPAAARAISFTDPGGTDSFVWLAATQTLTGKTLTSPTLTTPALGSATGTDVSVTGALFGRGFTGQGSVNATQAEMYVSGGAAVFGGFNRGAGTYQPVQVSGSTVDLQISGVNKASLNATGDIGFGGTATVPFSTPVASRHYVAVIGNTGAGMFEMQGNAADADGTIIGGLQWQDTNQSVSDKRSINILGLTSGTTANNRGGDLVFYTRPNGGAVVLERLRINQAGTTVITGTLTATAIASNAGVITGTLCYTSSAPGTITYDSGGVCNLSREEYKDNFGPILHASSIIDQLRPFWGAYKEQFPMDHHIQPFLGAHQVESVDPRLVTYNDDGVRSVRYMNLTAVLVAGMQEQHRAMESLSARMHRLEGLH